MKTHISVRSRLQLFIRVRRLAEQIVKSRRDGSLQYHNPMSYIVFIQTTHEHTNLTEKRGSFLREH